jgi:hypothetical protein
VNLRNRVLGATRRRVLSAIRLHGPNVALAGSWKTNDVHLLTTTGSLCTLSDVDLLTSDLLVPELQSSVRTSVQNVLNGAGLRSVRISIRSTEDFCALPHSAEWNAHVADSAYWSTKHDPLAFWSNVAAMEAAITLARNDNIAREVVASYAIVKFFFTFVRNAALTQGTVLRGYESVCRWAFRSTSTLPLYEALRVKHGTCATLSRASAAQLLSPSSLRSFAAVPDSICGTAADICRTLFRSELLPIDDYVAGMTSLASTRALHDIVRHETVKYLEATAARG